MDNVQHIIALTWASLWDWIDKYHIIKAESNDKTPFNNTGL